MSTDFPRLCRDRWAYCRNFYTAKLAYHPAVSESQTTRQFSMPHLETIHLEMHTSATFGLCLKKRNPILLPRVLNNFNLPRMAS